MQQPKRSGLGAQGGLTRSKLTDNASRDVPNRNHQMIAPKIQPQIGSRNKFGVQNVNQMGPRPNSKAYNRNGIMSNGSQSNLNSNFMHQNEMNTPDVETVAMKNELKLLMDKMEQMNKILKEKDDKIESQRAEITNLRKKNFDFRAKYQKLEEQNPKKSKKPSQSASAQDESNEAMESLQEAIKQQQVAKQREREMMMQVMMSSMMGENSAQAEEDRLIQRAIEESKQDADPTNPNTDNMTYEQLLELEENNGKVSKGLTKDQIKNIREKMWTKGKDETGDHSCSICFDDFERYQRFKQLDGCGHQFHSKCLDTWLENEKRCPICNADVQIK